ncbi:MAG: UPF0182 family protein [Candidatus Sulfobium sp.]
MTLPAAWDTQLVRRVLDNLDKLKFIMPAMFGFIVALLFHDSWFEFLSYFNAVPFGHSDPIFHKGVSFYLFAVPVFDNICDAALALPVISLLLVVVLYLARGTVSVDRNRVEGKDISGDMALSNADIERNKATINNIRPGSGSRSWTPSARSRRYGPTTSSSMSTTTVIK